MSTLAIPAASAGLQPALFKPRMPAVVWVTLIASGLLLLCLVIAGQATLLRIAIPSAAALMGLVLYVNNSIAYVQFTLWTWFLAPLIRRLVDWRFGFEDQNLVLAAPLFVSMVACVGLFRLRRTGGASITPFVLCLAGVLYGFLVGTLRFALHAPHSTGIGEVLFGLCNWLGPLAVGMLVYTRRDELEAQRKAFCTTLLWATLLLGAYGIFQYVYAPAWDAFWLKALIDAGGLAFGSPEPFQMRICSTASSPVAFSNIMMCGLLVVLFSKSRLKPLASSVGYAALLLTLVRTAWLGWLISLLCLCKGSNKRHIFRLLVSLALLPVLLLPLLLIPDASEALTQRMQTFSNIGKDESMLDREYMYKVLVSEAVQQPFGTGLANQHSVNNLPLDSGILQGWFMLGPLGFALYGSGLLLALFKRDPRTDYDTDSALFRAIAIGLLAELPGAAIASGQSGGLLWMTLALAAAKTIAPAAEQPVHELELQQH